MKNARRVGLMLAVALAGCLAACVLPNSPQPLLGVAAVRTGTEVVVCPTDTGQIADVRCPTGIGWAEFMVPAGVPLNQVAFRLHLRGLEGCTVVRGESKIQISVSSHGDLAVHQWREDGQPVAAGETVAVSVVAKAGGVPKIPLDGWFELRLPDSGAEERAVRLEWVDFYR